MIIFSLFGQDSHSVSGAILRSGDKGRKDVLRVNNLGSPVFPDTARRNGPVFRWTVLGGCSPLCIHPKFCAATKDDETFLHLLYPTELRAIENNATGLEPATHVVPPAFAAKKIG